MRRTLTAAAVASLSALLGACSSTAVNTTPASVNQVQTSAAHSSTSAAAPPTTSSAAKKAGAGDTIGLQGHHAGDVLDVTLVKVVDPAPPANSYAGASAGKHLVGVQLRIVNHGHAVYQADPQMGTKLKDAAGETFTASITSETSAGQALDSGLTLSPGDTALGFVVFEVPDGLKAAQVQYLVNTVGGNVAQWTIG